MQLRVTISFVLITLALTDVCSKAIFQWTETPARTMYFGMPLRK